MNETNTARFVQAWNTALPDSEDKLADLLDYLNWSEPEVIERYAADLKLRMRGN